MVVAATGSWNKAAENFKNLVADCATFRSETGSADAAAAKEKIFISAYVLADGDAFADCYWLISRFGSDLVHAASLPNGQMKWYFERPIPEAYRDAGLAEDAEQDFSNALEVILAEVRVLSGQAGYLFIREIQIIEGPFQLNREGVPGAKMGCHGKISWGLES